MLFDQLNQLQTGLRIVNGVDQHLGFRSPGRLQQIDAGSITIEYFHIEFTQGFYVVRIVIENDHFNAAGEQQTSGDLPEAPEPGDDHPRLFFVDLIGFTPLFAVRFFQTRQQHQQDRRGGHR